MRQAPIRGSDPQATVAIAEQRPGCERLSFQYRIRIDFVIG
jgi:hypothetical protein